MVQNEILARRNSKYQIFESNYNIINKHENTINQVTYHNLGSLGRSERRFLMSSTAVAFFSNKLCSKSNIKLDLIANDK